jgi:tRNA(fMet)-specific endonuclease VapC
MIVLDTDIVTLLFTGHEKTQQRMAQAAGPFAIAIVTRFEVVFGRFASLLKAADGQQLLRAMERLQQALQYLDEFLVIPVDAAAAAEFDKLRANKKLKKIGRPDLLIASIALANKVTLVTRNLRDFRLIPRLKVENWAD